MKTLNPDSNIFGSMDADATHARSAEVVKRVRFPTSTRARFQRPTPLFVLQMKTETGSLISPASVYSGVAKGTLT